MWSARISLFSRLRWERIVIAVSLTSHKMMWCNTLSIWVFLSSSCPWIEEIVDALESSVSLTWIGTLFASFAKWVLKLDVWKSGEHLAACDTSSNWTALAVFVLSVCLHEAFVDGLSLVYCSMSRGLRLLQTVCSRRQWHHILMMVGADTLLVIAFLSALRHTICSFRSVLWSFDHRWQL